MTLVCYPTAGKRKAVKMCRWMAQSTHAQVAPESYPKLVGDSPAFFYGWNAHTGPLIQKCIAKGREWYYCDNAYYYGRDTFFRITKNRLMHDGTGKADPARWDALDITPKPLRGDGDRILIATQSELFYQILHGTTRDEWVAEVTAELRNHTDRPIEVCNKPIAPWRGMFPHRNFEEMLPGAWAVVTHSSSVMVHAVVEGIPVFHTAPSMADSVGNAGLANIEDPYFPGDAKRLRWLAVLAANQWTGREIRDGVAWRDLNDA